MGSLVFERQAPPASAIDHALARSRQRVFWLDDAPPAPADVPLRGEHVAELAVVGGGYTGLWTAILAKQRRPRARVVVLEAATLGWAASGRNGGFCEASLTHGAANGRSRFPGEYDTLERLGEENLDAIARAVEEWRLDCDFERGGVLTVATEPHQLPWLAEDLGAEERVLDAAQTRARIDSPTYLGGRHSPADSALVHPAKLARELARVAREAGVEILERSAVTGLEREGDGRMRLLTAHGRVRAERVALATNAFPSLLRRNRFMTVPVYDYVLMTEPLDAAQLASIGWAGREGLTDSANQFHYARLTADNRILWGGYDAVYHAGGRIRPGYEDRPETFRRLASHFLTTFPQLEGVRFTHRWAGVIDTCSRFFAFFGTAFGGRVSYALGYTGLGVAATRFGARVMLDLLGGEPTELTELQIVRRKPLPFPPEPAATIGVRLTQRALDRADHDEGRRGPFLRTMDAVGLGFDS